MSLLWYFVIRPAGKVRCSQLQSGGNPHPLYILQASPGASKTTIAMSHDHGQVAGQKRTAVLENVSFFISCKGEVSLYA